jgi:hypothetical protein
MGAAVVRRSPDLAARVRELQTANKLKEAAG